MTVDDVAVAFIEESQNRARMSIGRINHCLDQLCDADIWWVPGEGLNSIGVIIQHLLGNLRQWIVSGVGGETDIRNRPAEFLVTEKTRKTVVQERLDIILDRVLETYANVDRSSLLENRVIQGFEKSMLSAIYGTMAHLELHAGQITYITRLRLGKSYSEFWRPASVEQGANLA